MIENIVKVLKQRQKSIGDQINKLEVESKKLNMAITALTGLSVKPVKAAQPPKKRKMSAAGRAAIAAGARARWAKIKGAKVAAPATARKRKMSAAGRAAIAAGARARWAKIRAAKA